MAIWLFLLRVPGPYRIANRTLRGRYRIDAKRLLTHRLLAHFKDRGLISDGTLLKHTYFGRKTDHDLRQVDVLEVLQIYRQLVFMDARKSSNLRKQVVAILDRLFPSLMNLVRAVYRDRAIVDPASVRTSRPALRKSLDRSTPDYRESLDGAAL